MCYLQMCAINHAASAAILQFLLHPRSTCVAEYNTAHREWPLDPMMSRPRHRSPLDRAYILARLRCGRSESRRYLHSWLPLPPDLKRLILDIDIAFKEGEWYSRHSNTTLLWCSAVYREPADIKNTGFVSVCNISTGKEVHVLHAAI